MSTRVLQTILGILALSFATIASPVAAQTSLSAPALGLYDAAGYPYYPVETQVFGARLRPVEVFVSRGEQIESRPGRSAARARLAGPPVQVSRLPVAISLEGISRPARLRPMPLPNTTIMDPWNVGVFR